MDDSHGKWSLKNATNFETAIWAIKIALMCVGIGSCLILFKIAVIPCISTFLISTIPCFWSSIKVFLSPIVLLHFIVVAIFALSTFHHQSQIIKPVKNALLHTQKSLNLNFVFRSEEEETAVFEVAASQEATKEPPLQDQEWENITVTQNQAEEEEEEEEEEVIKPLMVVASVDKNVDPSMEASDDEALSEKSSEIIGETTGEEKAGPLKPEEPDDSMDSVWNAIMEKEGRPATWRLKKSDTWDSPPRAVAAAARAEAVPPPPAGPCRRELRKSGTFRERVASKREKQTTYDEVNWLADEFIRKTKNDFRLQREESDQRYMEMVNGGVY